MTVTVGMGRAAGTHLVDVGGEVGSRAPHPGKWETFLKAAMGFDSFNAGPSKAKINTAPSFPRSYYFLLNATVRLLPTKSSLSKRHSCSALGSSTSWRVHPSTTYGG